jgi:hypothetical protein
VAGERRSNGHYMLDDSGPLISLGSNGSLPILFYDINDSYY